MITVVSTLHRSDPEFYLSQLEFIKIQFISSKPEYLNVGLSDNTFCTSISLKYFMEGGIEVGYNLANKNVLICPVLVSFLSPGHKLE